MSSAGIGQMSAVETEQMSAVETGHMSAAETQQMYSIEIGQRPINPKHEHCRFLHGTLKNHLESSSHAGPEQA